MRENSWHLRTPTTEHFQWYRNLIDLNELTLEWQEELPHPLPSSFIPPGLSPEVSENRWMLDSLSQTPLESFLDDTSPQDVLYRLERMIWAMQASIVQQIEIQMTPKNGTKIDDAMNQRAWKLGKICAKTRWENLVVKKSHDLRDILFALHDSPFAGYPHRDGFLIRRALAQEVQIELKSCPHHIPYPEIKTSADRLCRLHSYWITGFAHTLNPNIHIEHIIQSPRCVQRWFFK